MPDLHTVTPNGEIELPGQMGSRHVNLSAEKCNTTGATRDHRSGPDRKADHVWGFPDFPEIRKIRILENPDFRFFRNLRHPISPNPDFRESDNPDFQISGLPNLRASGFPEI